MRSMVEGVLWLGRPPLHRRTGGPPPHAGEGLFPPRLGLATAQVPAERFGQSAGSFLVGFAHRDSIG